jgi:hypothetical protein
MLEQRIHEDPISHGRPRAAQQEAAGFVAYLTTLALAGEQPVDLWRVVRGGRELWFERFDSDGWHEDEQLREALEAVGTVRLTPSEARWVAAERYGRTW